MGIVFLAALAVSLGILGVQVLAGARGGHHDLGHGHGGSHQIHDANKPGAAVGGLLTMFVSVRFWVFFALGFGMSGALLTYLTSQGALATLGIALGAGAASGSFATFAFRAVVRTSVATRNDASAAVGAVGKVLVACSKGQVGQIRVQLAGNSVDFMATTDEDDLERGEPVLVQEMRGSVAHVAKPPPEIG